MLLRVWSAGPVHHHLIEMQNLRPYPISGESESAVEQDSPGDLYVHSSLRSTTSFIHSTNIYEHLLWPDFADWGGHGSVEFFVSYCVCNFLLPQI